MQKKHFPFFVAVGAAILLALGVVFACRLHADPQPDYLQYTADANPAQNQHADFTLHLGNRVHSAAVWAELWQNGECLFSDTLLLNASDTALHIFVGIDGLSDFYAPNAEVKLSADGTGSVQQEYTLPKSAVGYVFSSYEDEDVIEVAPGEEKILANWSFDLGSGHTVGYYSLEDLPNASCLLVIKASFSKDASIPEAQLTSEKPQ